MMFERKFSDRRAFLSHTQLREGIIERLDLGSVFLETEPGPERITLIERVARTQLNKGNQQKWEAAQKAMLEAWEGGNGEEGLREGVFRLMRQAHELPHLRPAPFFFDEERALQAHLDAIGRWLSHDAQKQSSEEQVRTFAESLCWLRDFLRGLDKTDPSFWTYFEWIS
jgi:hypothetical protein